MSEQKNPMSENSPGSIYYKVGKTFFMEGEFEQATDYYHLAAEEGSANAQYSLAVCYEEGLGVPKDSVQAIHYFQLAANQGHTEAKRSLDFYERAEAARTDSGKSRNPQLSSSNSTEENQLSNFSKHKRKLRSSDEDQSGRPTKKLRSDIEQSSEDASTVESCGYDDFQDDTKETKTSSGELNLEFNNIGDEGLKHLAEVLLDPESGWKKISLCSSDISDVGVGYLAEALKNNKTITWVDLSYNKGITDSGVDKLIEMLKVNTTLMDLLLDGGEESISIEKLEDICRIIVARNNNKNFQTEASLQGFHPSPLSSTSSTTTTTTTTATDEEPKSLFKISLG